MKKQAIIIVAIALLALPLTGCVENMRDLKERITPAAEEEPTPIEQTTNTTNTTKNVTKQFKPPIARAAIYDAGGALLTKSTFVAEDMMSVLRVDEGSELTLNAADSEIQEPGSTIESYTWTLGETKLEGLQAKLTLDLAGIHPLVLEVVDSNGNNDTQTIMLGIAPAPFDVTLELVTSGPIVGAQGVGQSGTATFDVAPVIDDMPVKAVGAKVIAKPTSDCDAGVAVEDAEGTEYGDEDSAGVPDDQTETLVIAKELPNGTYTVIVYGYACVSPEGVPVTVVIQYVPILAGLDDDGHGAHAH